MSYVYNAFGQRVEKIVNGSARYYLYGMSGRMVTELNASGGWERGDVYAVGMPLATYSGGTSGTTYFTYTNGLGTVRARTGASGSGGETCTSLPFGDDLSCSGTDASPLHFTGQQQDAETGLAAFPFRYYSEVQGRWLSPDPAGFAAVNPAEPQSWNAYAYVGNQPLSATDPNGLLTLPRLTYIMGPMFLNGFLGGQSMEFYLMNIPVVAVTGYHDVPYLQFSSGPTWEISDPNGFATSLIGTVGWMSQPILATVGNGSELFGGPNNWPVLGAAAPVVSAPRFVLPAAPKVSWGDRLNPAEQFYAMFIDGAVNGNFGTAAEDAAFAYGPTLAAGFAPEILGGGQAALMGGRQFRGC